MARVTLVYAEWCTACPTAKRFWTRLRDEVLFEYEEIDIDSPAGRELARRHHISSVPTTLIDGRAYFVGTPEKTRATSILKSLG